MSSVAIQIKLDTKMLDKIAAGLDGNTDKVLGIVTQRLAQYTINNIPPRVDTGQMMGSIKGERKGNLNWWVHDGVPYGVFQELGTSRGIQGHFFMTRAAEAAGAEFNSGALWKALFA